MKQFRSFSNALILTVVTVIVMLVAGHQPAASFQGMPAIQPEADCGAVACVYLARLHSACGPGLLTFSDDFSDPSSGWASWEDSSTRVGYLDGEFQLLLKIEEGRAGLARADIGIGSGYRLAADVRNVAGIPGHYGLLFGFQGGLDYDFYTFEVSPAGDFYVYYHERTDPDPQETTLLYSGWSAAVMTGVSANNLAVIHRPATLYFYANDQLLVTIPSDRTGAEQLGMLVTATTEANLDVRFDNLQVNEFACEPGS